MESKRMGDVLIIENSQKITNADNEYYYLRVQMPNGEEIPVMFTDTEFYVGVNRALKNTEDVPKVSWIKDLLD